MKVEIIALILTLNLVQCQVYTNPFQIRNLFLSELKVVNKLKEVKFSQENDILDEWIEM